MNTEQKVNELKDIKERVRDVVEIFYDEVEKELLRKVELLGLELVEDNAELKEDLERQENLSRKVNNGRVSISKRQLFYKMYGDIPMYYSTEYLLQETDEELMKNDYKNCKNFIKNYKEERGSTWFE